MVARLAKTLIRYKLEEAACSNCLLIRGIPPPLSTLNYSESVRRLYIDQTVDLY